MRDAPWHSPEDDGVACPASFFEKLGSCRVSLVEVEVSNQKMWLVKCCYCAPGVDAGYDEAATDRIDSSIFVHTRHVRSDKVCYLVREMRVQLELKRCPEEHLFQFFACCLTI